MDSKVCCIVGLAFIAGYISGSSVSRKRYSDWQKSHQFSCWRTKKSANRPGDFPPVFVIEKKGACNEH